MGSPENKGFLLNSQMHKRQRPPLWLMTQCRRGAPIHIFRKSDHRSWKVKNHCFRAYSLLPLNRPQFYDRQLWLSSTIVYQLAFQPIISNVARNEEGRHERLISFLKVFL